MNISQAAQHAGIPVKTARYYADIGLVVPTSRSPAGYRQYDDKSLRRLAFAARARKFGFSIDDCRELLDLYGNRERSSADVKSMALERLEQIRAKQRELQSLHDELASLVSQCRGDSRPDCPIIDFLG